MIDVDFNFFSEVKEGQDPDSKSPTLRNYHKLLWSKPLPSGKVFELKDNPPELSKKYLYHKSDLGYFVFGSDAITHSHRNHKRKKHITGQIPDEVNDLFIQGGNIASYIIFPKNKINNGQTINMARGVNSLIDDRFDLTLECIKRFYKNLSSPLYNNLLKYKNFFDLFESFENYVEFFLLQDLIDNKSSTIKFYMPFDDFKTRPSFNSVEEYISYKSNVLEFNSNRKSRIKSLKI
tara:strand:- start:228 stop:932 length:705 start_codon:yes stop_codon:yes gene_type:complete